jgi:hypothetical protein
MDVRSKNERGFSHWLARAILRRMRLRRLCASCLAMFLLFDFLEIFDMVMDGRTLSL